MAEQIYRSQLRVMLNRKIIDRLSDEATAREITLSAYLDELLTKHFLEN
jgi:hypothetical protein